MLATVIFIQSVTVCEITTFKLLKWSRFESLIFKKVDQGHEIQRCRIGRWIALYGLQDGEENGGSTSSFSPLVHQRGTPPHTHTHR